MNRLPSPSGRLARLTSVAPGVCCGLAVLLLATLARADIECDAQYAAHDPIVARVTITDVPEGAKLRGSFAISDGEYLPAGENIYHIWAPPGKHVLTAQGVWVLTKDVTIEGQTFPVLLDFGQFSYRKEITVGTAPEPGPDPQPPPGARVAVILEETVEKTPAQDILWDQLRKVYPPGKLSILDDDLPTAAKYLPLVKLQTRPVLLVLTEQGALVREVSCPASVAEVQREVNR